MTTNQSAEQLARECAGFILTPHYESYGIAYGEDFERSTQAILRFSEPLQKQLADILTALQSADNSGNGYVDPVERIMWLQATIEHLEKRVKELESERDAWKRRAEGMKIGNEGFQRDLAKAQQRVQELGVALKWASDEARGRLPDWFHALLKGVPSNMVPKSECDALKQRVAELEQQSKVMRQCLVERAFYAPLGHYKRSGYTLNTDDATAARDIDYRDCKLYPTADEAVDAYIAEMTAALSTEQKEGGKKQ